MTDKELFILDKCTPKEAEAFIKKGSVAYPIQDWIDIHTPGSRYFEGAAIGEDVPTIEEIKKGLHEIRYVKDHNGNEYILEYVL